ncbi:hypothetical protein HZH68_012630 [Vespula germanica]|uniref:Uncharacterized protein n=1 Tax=Vespula germanica TaxID=30212 RepID=A0A834JHX9_VESGE|nr:hypothetical protein HZH68_012630 [Vespula germanica]
MLRSDCSLSLFLYLKIHLYESENYSDINNNNNDDLETLLDTSSDLHLTRAEEYKRLRSSPMNNLDIACNAIRIGSNKVHTLEMFYIDIKAETLNNIFYTEFTQNTSRFIRKNVFPLHNYRLANSHPVDVD